MNGRRRESRRDRRLAYPRRVPIRPFKSGRRWIIEGAYWISYSLTTPPVISGVFYAMADIPKPLLGRMIYGYARVSTDGQRVDSQVRQLRKAGAS